MLMRDNPKLIAVTEKFKPAQFPSEREDVDHTLWLLQQLHIRANNFASAIELLTLLHQMEYEVNARYFALNSAYYAAVQAAAKNPALMPTIQAMGPPQGWQEHGREQFRVIAMEQIAGRDAGMTVYHFGKSLNAFNASLRRRCPTLYAATDHALLASSSKLFGQHFPRAELLRHSIAHSAELAGTREELAKHQPLFWRKEGTIFTFTMEKKELKLDVSAGTLAVLDAIVSGVCDALLLLS